MRSQMFCKKNAPKNAAKFKGKHLHQILLTPAQIITKEILKIVTKTFFNRTSLNNCFFHQFNLLTVLRRFCFGTYIIYLNFRAILGYIKIHRSRPLGLYIFFTYKYIGVKITHVLKEFMIILYDMETIFTKHPRVLNIPEFWTCLWFWRCQRSEYARVLNIPRLWICLWFWICQGSEQTRVLNMLRLTGFWICLNMLHYV